MPHLRAAFLWTMIVSFVSAAAMCVFAIVYDGGRGVEQIMVTALLVGAFSLTSLGCAIALDRHRLPGVGWTGIAASGLALAVWLMVIWGDLYRFRQSGGFHWEELAVRFGTAFTCVAAWCPLTGVLAVLPLYGSVGRITRLLTVLAVGLFGAMVTITVWAEVYEEWMAKLLGVLAVLGVCGSLVTPLLTLMERIRGQASPESIERRVKVNVECPRCRMTQPIPSGRARCSQCGLKMRIEVEEPRCRCGYLLYRLEGDNCPECGRRVDA